MPPSEYPLPDITIGRHPDYGIVATTPKDLAAGAWMLRGFGFHPVPGQRHLYALENQQHHAQARATRAVDVLRRASFRVQADAEFDALPTAQGISRSQRADPDIAFAEHPQLGIVAATNGSGTGGQILEEHGWRHHPDLDIHTLPVAAVREQTLAQVARVTRRMQSTDLQVAIEPDLAQQITARLRPPSAKPPRAVSATNTTTRRTSTARTDLPNSRPAPAPTASPAAPRAAFTRTR